MRSRAALAYGQVQERIDAGAAGEPFALLGEVGERRLTREAARGGVSLGVPAQAIDAAGSGYRLHYETPLPVERWNAQVSLLTGICAARIMMDGGVGLFRVLALCRGQEPPAWALEALPDMPGVMSRAGARERAAERLALDYLESVLLAGRIGEVFDATVVDVRDDRPVVQIADPAVVAQLDTRGPRPGERLRVRLAEADPAARRVVFAPA